MEDGNGHVELTTGQKAMLAIDLIEHGMTFDQARDQAHVGHRAIEKARGVLRRRPDLGLPLRTGEISLDRALAEAGFQTKDTNLKLGNTFGKGDKWPEASIPLLRYLQGWQARNFEFKHLNPREARKRLERIELLEALLDQAKVDLEQRAVRGSLSAPREGH